MSIIQPDSIKAIAHSIDLPRLSDEAAKTLAPDVEYRLREVVQVRVSVCACLPASQRTDMSAVLLLWSWAGAPAAGHHSSFSQPLVKQQRQPTDTAADRETHVQAVAVATEAAP